MRQFSSQDISQTPGGFPVLTEFPGGEIAGSHPAINSFPPEHLLSRRFVVLIPPDKYLFFMITLNKLTCNFILITEMINDYYSIIIY